MSDWLKAEDYTIKLVFPAHSKGLQHLWKRDTYQFQKWAVESVDGFVTAIEKRVTVVLMADSISMIGNDTELKAPENRG